MLHWRSQVNLWKGLTMQSLRVGLIGARDAGKSELRAALAKIIENDQLPPLPGSPSANNANMNTVVGGTERITYYQNTLNFEEDNSNKELYIVDTVGEKFLEENAPSNAQIQRILENLETSERAKLVEQNTELYRALNVKNLEEHNKRMEEAFAQGQPLHVLSTLPEIYRSTVTCDALILVIAPEDLTKKSTGQLLNRFAHHIQIHQKLQIRPQLEILIVFTKFDSYGVLGPTRFFNKPEHIQLLKNLTRNRNEFQSKWRSLTKAILTEKDYGEETQFYQDLFTKSTSRLWEDLFCAEKELDPRSINAYFVAALPTGHRHSLPENQGVMDLFGDLFQSLLKFKGEILISPPSPFWGYIFPIIFFSLLFGFGVCQRCSVETLRGKIVKLNGNIKTAQKKSRQAIRHALLRRFAELPKQIRKKGFKTWLDTEHNSLRKSFPLQSQGQPIVMLDNTSLPVYLKLRDSESDEQGHVYHIDFAPRFSKAGGNASSISVYKLPKPPSALFFSSIQVQQLSSKAPSLSQDKALRYVVEFENHKRLWLPLAIAWAEEFESKAKPSAYNVHCWKHGRRQKCPPKVLEHLKDSLLKFKTKEESKFCSSLLANLPKLQNKISIAYKLKCQSQPPLPIGSAVSQQLMEMQNRLESHQKNQQKRLQCSITLSKGLGSIFNLAKESGEKISKYILSGESSFSCPFPNQKVLTSKNLNKLLSEYSHCYGAKSTKYPSIHKAMVEVEKYVQKVKKAPKDKTLCTNLNNELKSFSAWKDIKASLDVHLVWLKSEVKRSNPYLRSQNQPLRKSPKKTKK